MVNKRTNAKQKSVTRDRTIKVIPKTYHALIEKKDEYLARRPHRSFKRTRRRDYVRSLEMPGYWQFTMQVTKILGKRWKTYIGLGIIFTFLNGVFVGISSQQAYADITNLLTDTGSDVFSGDWGALGQSGLLAVTGLIGAFSPQMSDVQQVYAVLFGLLLWLTLVWLLREQMRGNKPRLLDGIYTAGSPIIPTAIVFLIATLQLVPVAIAIISITAGTQVGAIADGGILSMILWVAAGLLGVVSLYWVTSTIIALVVVTLPGMRPMQAIRTAGDLVIGRRLRILTRFVWLGLLLVLSATLIVVPAILFDRWLTSVAPALVWIPIVPLVVTLYSSLALIFSASYTYMLYRKVVDDDASPA